MENNKYLSLLEEIKPKLETGAQKSTSLAEPSTSETSTGNRYLDVAKGFKAQPREGLIKGAARTALQLPLGYIKQHPLSYVPDLLKMATEASSQDVLAQLKEEEPGVDFSQAEVARQKAMEFYPTQELAEKLIEKHTGAPLQPITETQKALRLAGTAAGFKPGAVGGKAQAAVIAPAAKLGFEKLGVPEPVAEVLGLLTSGFAPTASFQRLTKPSGMAIRKFEGIEKPTKVTEARAEAINKSLEKDFRQISDKLLEKNKTYSVMKQDNLFKEKVGDYFKDVENLAEKIPGEFSTGEIRSNLQKRFRQREVKGITPDEYEREFSKQIKSINKSIPFTQMTAKQGVEQFRKNNKSLSQIYESGKSSAANQAKRDAILEYNRAIEDVFEKRYPDSEFNKLFRFTNKRWSEINDVEQASDFVNKMFDGKVNYKEVKKIFGREKEAKPFQRLLGEEGFKDFKTLTEDLLSTEKPMQYIEKVKDAGWKDLAKILAHFSINPKTAALHAYAKYGKMAYNMLLDKPKYAVLWKSAWDNVKSGKYAQADKQFSQLYKAVTQYDQANQTNQQATKK